MAKNIRENFSNYAGSGYLISNLFLTFGETVKNAVQGVDVTAASVVQDISPVGATMLASATALTFSTGNKGNLLGHSLGLAGWSLLVMQAENVMQGFGAVTGGGSSVYAIGSTLALLNKEKKQAFLNNASDVVRKYPYAWTGVLAGVSSASVAIGSMFSGNAVMASVAALWTGCAVLMGLSAAKSKNQDNLCQPG